MNSEKDSFPQRFKWHIVIICVALVIVFLLSVFTDIFQTAETSRMRLLVIMLGVLIILSALLAMLSRVFKIVDTLQSFS
ncbi:MAG: hypothetical protein ACUZ77_07470, partial [Candidatus Brocadiales bacterium]